MTIIENTLLVSYLVITTHYSKLQVIKHKEYLYYTTITFCVMLGQKFNNYISYKVDILLHMLILNITVFIIKDI